MTTLFIVNKLWLVIFGLTAIIILLLLFQPTREPNGEKIKALEYAIAISDQQKKYLEDKHKKDSTASAQKIAELRDSLSKEQKHGVKLSNNLAVLKSKPRVVKIVEENPVIDTVFQHYDSLLESKDQQLKIQADMIEAQRIENVRITSNFMERLDLGQQAFDAQKEISDSYKKQNRKVRRANKALKVAVVVSSVGFLLLGSQL